MEDTPWWWAVQLADGTVAVKNGHGRRKTPGSRQWKHKYQEGAERIAAAVRAGTYHRPPDEVFPAEEPEEVPATPARLPQRQEALGYSFRRTLGDIAFDLRCLAVDLRVGVMHPQDVAELATRLAEDLDKIIGIEGGKTPYEWELDAQDDAM